jgi:hypothetical protein
MLQLFHTDVAKVYQDVAHVAMVVHVCCKLLFSMFHLFFPTYVTSVFYLNVSYVFMHMMQVFYLKVAYVYNGFKCFSSVFASIQTHVSMFYLFSDICCNYCIWMF